MDEKQQLYNYALKLLGGRRYTVAGMEKKLAARVKKIYGATKADADPTVAQGADRGACAVTADDISAIIARLKEYKFLDDREYADMYIRDHGLRKPQGLMMLKMKMAAKGLPKDIIAGALEKAGLDEVAAARAAAAKKMKSLAGLPSQKKKEKLARFLASRGFNGSAVSNTLKSFPSDAEEDYLSP